MESPLPPLLTCTVCGTDYTPQRVRKNLKYCGEKCRNKGVAADRRARGAQSPVATTCTVAQCGRPSKWNGAPLCGMHYQRERVHGEVGGTAPVRGGRMGVAPCGIDGCGRLYYAKGLCALHYNRKRVTGDAGEAGLRRKPASDGNVWRWTDPKNNRIENLELWSSSQPSGQRVEDKIAWAKELLARYNEPT